MRNKRATTATRPISSPAAARTSYALSPSRSTASRPSRSLARPALRSSAMTGTVATLTKAPKVVLFDDKAGKPTGIHLMIGRRPVAAFGNSTGDQQMLEYTQAGGGRRLMMLVQHDDDKREFAYGPKSEVGTFPDTLVAEAKEKGWIVISMKNDWKRVFAYEQ